MRLRGLSSMLALAAIVATGVTFSGAVFTAASANPGNAFGASTAFNLTATMNDPGANLRATVSLTASAADGEDGSSISSVTIQRSPAGAGTWTDVCTDNSSPYSCSFDTTAVSDGLFDFRATAQNDAGGSATSTPVTNRRVDNTAPSAGMTDPGTPLRATVTLDASGSDGGSGMANVRIQRSPAGAGTWTEVCTDASSPYSCSFDTTSVTDGLYDFRAVSTDNAGNTTNSATVSSRRIDNTAPSATMTNPGSPITGMKSFDGTASDTGSGVASLTFQSSPTGQNDWSAMCSDTTPPYVCGYDTSALADGQYDLRSRAVDVAGNAATSTVYSGAIVDNTAPSATMTDPGAYLRGTVGLDATAGDGAGSGVLNVKIQRSPAGAGTWTDVCTDAGSPYSCSLDTTSVTDGLYDFRAIATDNNSLSTTSAVVTNRRVDNTAPTAAVTDPGANLRLTVTVSAPGTDTGGSGVANVKVQRSPAGAGTWTDICTDTTSPYSCDWDTTGVSDGLYDLRSITMDNAGNTTISATVTNRRVDNTAPTAGLTDPGSPLRQTVTLNATGTDTSGSGVLNVKIQSAPTGTSTWTDICSDATTPYSCSWNTTGVTDGGYDLRAVTTDNAGNVTYSSVVSNRVVDNTAPAAVDIQTTNGGLTVGRPETGDTLTFTYSEQLLSTSILAGWNGTATAVTVRMNNSGNSDQFEVWNAVNNARLPLTNTFVSLNGNFIQNSATFAATMAQNGASITITLGALTGGTVRTETGNATLSWPSSATPTDLAGNACTGNTATEGGAADQDF